MAFLGLSQWLISEKKICLQWRRCRFDPYVRKIPCRRAQLPTPADRGAWRPIVHGVAQSQTQLKQSSVHTHMASLPGLCLVYVVVVVVVQLLSLIQLFCNPMDCSPPGSSIHGISQARILKWVTILFSRGSSQPRDQTHISWITGRLFIIETPGKPIPSI